VTVPDALWTSTPLGAACEINPRPKVTGFSDDASVLFVPMAAVDDLTGEITKPEHRTLGEVRRKSYRTFMSGDVIFAKITPCMENGKAAVVPDIDNGLGFGSTEFHVLRPNSGVNPRFIWHLVRQESFRRFAEKHMTGSVGQARVPADFLRNLPIKLPPKDFQDRIVVALDTATSSGHIASGHVRVAQRAIKRFRQAVLAAACSGRLTTDWREASDRSQGSASRLARHHADNPDLAVNRRRTKPALGLAIPDQSDQFPPEWAYKHVRELVSLGAIIDIQDGNHGELYPRKDDFVTSGGVPYISAESVDQEVRIDRAPRLKSSVAARLRIGFARPGDVILTHNATVGRVAVLPQDSQDVVLSTSTTYYRTDRRVLLPEYLALFMRSPFFQRQLFAVMEQTTRNQVPVTKQVELFLAVPTIEEQRIIVARATAMLGSADQQLNRLEQAAQRMERSVQSLLAKAFRGELVPTEVNPLPPETSSLPKTGSTNGR
jgi:type I restriction enzyme, S subunit